MKYEMNRGWKTFGIVVLTLLFAVAIFCSVAAILSHCHNVGFVAEIQSWLDATK